MISDETEEQTATLREGSVEQLLQLILDDPDGAKSYAKTSRITLEDVKKVGAFLGIASSRFSKSRGVDTIVEFVKTREEMKTAVENLSTGLQKNRNVLLD